MRTLHIAPPDQPKVTQCGKRARPGSSVILSKDASPTHAHYYLDDNERVCRECYADQLVDHYHHNQKGA